MQEVEVFVSSASNPVNGHWVQLPMEETKLSKQVKQITNSFQGYMIADYIANFKINQYENIFKLNHFVSSLDELYEDQQLAILYLVNQLGYDRAGALEEYIEVQVYINSSLEDIAYELVDDYDIPDFIRYHIDYVSLANSLEQDGWYYDKDNHCCYHYV